MKKLALTETERLILANQYEILAHLKSDKSLDDLAENLREGHRWIYETKLSVSDDLPEEQVQHVLDILSIYDAIDSSYEVLSDKSGIDEKRLAFPGFDGNNECELLSFARALSKNGTYSHILGDTVRNSHGSTSHVYSRMIGIWKEMGAPRFSLARDQIIKLLG